MILIDVLDGVLYNDLRRGPQSFFFTAHGTNGAQRGPAYAHDEQRKISTLKSLGEGSSAGVYESVGEHPLESRSERARERDSESVFSQGALDGRGGFFLALPLYL
ncbi:hypothetical protein Taro_034282 [Colocasia esculenta]|uniref:Uncharacterized protein n=1 Tax=Colocasia esculenta TaxID=4460 RepID=A0A843WBH6_COLES|nr:hypothetical protein [Colocasia esculenta]